MARTAHSVALVAAVALASGAALFVPASGQPRSESAPDGAAAASPPEVLGSIAPSKATVGDRVRATLSVARDSTVSVEFPGVARSVGPFEVVDVVAYPEEPLAGRILERRDYVLVPFETGELRLPGLPFAWTDQSGEAGTVVSDTLYVFVESVLVDTAAAGSLELRDIKPPFELPRRVWPYIVGAAILAATAVGGRLLRRWLRARSQAPDVSTEEVARARRAAAHRVAFERLRALEEEDLPGRGEIERFYVELTDVLRRYLGDRFGVDAIDHTTAELPPLLFEAGVRADELDWTLALLSLADLSKFAREHPDAERARGDLGDVREFVDKTRFADTEGGQP